MADSTVRVNTTRLGRWMLRRECWLAGDPGAFLAPPEREEWIIAESCVPTSFSRLDLLEGGTLRWRRVLAAGGAGFPRDPGFAEIGGMLFVGNGNSLFALRSADGAVAWIRKADDAAVLGVHPAGDGKGVLVHGELEISRWTLAGERAWGKGGADIFSEGFSIGPDGIRAVDFGGRAYRFREDGTEI